MGQSFNRVPNHQVDLKETQFAHSTIPIPDLASSGRTPIRAAFVTTMCCLAFSGCSGKSPATSAPDTAAEVTTQAQVTNSSSEDSGSNQGNSNNQADGPAKSPNANSPVARLNPDVTSKETKSTPKSSVTTAKAATSVKPVPATMPPIAEQIAKWTIPIQVPLQLLCCADFSADSVVQCMAIHPDGERLVIGGSWLTGKYGYGGPKLNLGNVKNPNTNIDLIAVPNGNQIERAIRTVAISPNGNWLAAGLEKGMLRIWEISNQHEVVAIRTHDGDIRCLAFSPNSETVATSSDSGEVRLWQVSNGQNIKNLKVSEQAIVRLGFLSDTLLASASSETSIWNVNSGQKETVLSKGYVIGPALGISPGRDLLAFADADSKVHFWDVQKSSLSAKAPIAASAALIDFSSDGKKIAVYSNDSNIYIWDAVSGQIVQAINADGGRTRDLKWLPGTYVLVIASERGLVRMWGSTESATSLGISPLVAPVIESITEKTTKRRSLTPAQLLQVIDLRSFPRLPGAVPQWIDVGRAMYSVNASLSEAESFYRYLLGKSGWKEIDGTDRFLPGISFRKEGCELNVSLTPMTAPAGAGTGTLQVSLHFAGNYDARWLPNYAPIDSKGSWSSFNSVSYRTKADLTDVEVALLKQLHEAGWTPYTRLNASGFEEVNSRSISMIQGSSCLTIFMRHPADSPNELSVQSNISVSHKSLPIPSDSSWIEFDSSTELTMVANTRKDLKQTTEFFDAEMKADGWQASETGRHFKDDRGYLPYFRGQQDVYVRLVEIPEGGTRIIVGDAERSSWQLKKLNEIKKDSESSGIEAADLTLPQGAASIKFDVDQKQIQFEMPDVTLAELSEQLGKPLEAAEWKREASGLISEDYVLMRFSKGKTEIDFRLRLEVAKKTATAMVGGNGLLWGKPLPSAPVRISYETWMRRNHKQATLDSLEEFAEEMHKIPSAASPQK